MPITGLNSRGSKLAEAGVRHACARACAQARLPEMVLISPLWASRRNGCASGQRGAELVEKRWWKTTALLAQFGALQVGVELRQAVGQDHALVADGVRGQRHHVGILVDRRGNVPQALLGATARQIERMLEAFRRRPGAVDIQRRHHEQLLDARHRSARAFAARR